MATFRHGKPLMVPYTPDSNVSNGDVIATGVNGVTTVVAHHDIENGVAGDVSIGGGVYDLTPDANIAAFTEVFVDAANNIVSATSNTGPKFGYATVDLVNAVDGPVFHHPYIDA